MEFVFLAQQYGNTTMLIRSIPMNKSYTCSARVYYDKCTDAPPTIIGEVAGWIRFQYDFILI